MITMGAWMRRYKLTTIYIAVCVTILLIIEVVKYVNH